MYFHQLLWMVRSAHVLSKEKDLKGGRGVNKQNVVNDTELKLPNVSFLKLRTQITKTKVPIKVCVYEYFALAKKNQ